MGIQTKEQDPALLEAAFYSKPFNFSYTSLNRLLTAPNMFYKEYVLKEREVKTEKYLLEGTLIHYLVLDNQGFDDKFLVTPEDLPSANSMKIAGAVLDIWKQKVEEDPVNEQLELCDFTNEIMKILEEMNLHQKVGEDKRIAKIVEPKTEEYFKYLKKKGQREIIDSEMLDKCSKAADLIKTNQEIRELLGMDIVPDGIKFGVYNELPIEMEMKNLPFGLKGILDNMVVDVENKLIRINDFKTSGKSLSDFPESVEYWNYWLQAAIYLTLAMHFLESVIDDNWKVEIRFIVFDKYDQLYAFPVSNESLALWTTKMWAAFKDATYHYESKDFTLPYKFVAGDVSL
jgi:hypothetical protein